MKMNIFRLLFGAATLSFLSVPFAFQPAVATSGLRILSCRLESTNLVVTAEAPAGIRRLTLESRERAGVGAWRPRAVTRLDEQAGTATFRIPFSRQLEVIRVRGDDQEPLPASFYGATNDFPVAAAEEGGGGPEATDFANLNTRNDAAPTSPGGVATRTVTESDIWQIRGNTLYFFNQNRGLQVIDITNPDQATVTGTFELPASGDQMYAPGDSNIVLLARNYCGSVRGQESSVIVLEDRGGIPVLVTNIPLSGYLSESRMVGNALYVASQAYREITTTSNTYPTWEWGTVVTSFDLADPSAPVKRESVWYPGYGHEVAATDRFFFLMLQDPTDWWRSVVQLLDISSPDGTLVQSGSLQPAGWVPDKFKLNLHEDYLTVISEERGNTNVLTWLETFSVTNPANPQRLGRINFGNNERLHATRFDGRRAYVVTFHVEFRMDPLWIVDLTDPSKPTVTGQLEIPGWSTYLEPLGDRLVALGIETNRTSVSLFNVADPAKPTLLTRIPLGEGWSWSEGNWDEKAFKVLPDANLVLVPYSSHSTNGVSLQVQLIDLLADRLVQRGIIPSGFQPRRATVHNGRALSLSARELLSVDITDRDQPTIRGRTELSWPVDSLFVVGDFLVQAHTSDAYPYYYDYVYPPNLREPSPQLRVSPAEQPGITLATLGLTNLPVVGLSRNEDRLYVLQSQYMPPYPYYVLNDTNIPEPLLQWCFTVVDLGQLPNLQVIGRVSGEHKTPFGIASRAVYPRPGLVVWSSSSYYPYFTTFAMDALMPVSFRPYPIYASSGSRLIAFDVTDPGAPAFASEIDLAPTNSDHYSYASFSSPFADKGLVYISHRQSEYVTNELLTAWAWVTNGSTLTRVLVTNGLPMPEGIKIMYPYTRTWVQRYWLNVVDYSDPRDPLRRDLVELPGQLQGVDRSGDLLYAMSYNYEPQTNGYMINRQNLHALAYDGVAVNLVDTLPLPLSYPRPFAIDGSTIYIGHSGNPTYYMETNTTAHYLEAWQLMDTGKFAMVDRAILDEPAYQLKVYDGLLALRESYSRILLFDTSTPAELKLLARFGLVSCYYFNLENSDADRRGIWLPLGSYGVGRLIVPSP